MPVENNEIVEQLKQIADLLEIEGANPFRVRAYRNASRTIDSLSESIADKVGRGDDLSELPGIGHDLARCLTETVHTGRAPILRELERRLPRTLLDLRRIPSLGPKRIGQLFAKLGIRNLADLKAAAKGEALLQLPGFGEKSRQKIRDELAKAEGGETKRFLLATAEQTAHHLVNYLQQLSVVKHVTIAGSFRRRQETVGDLDLLVSSSRPTSVNEAFLRYPDIAKVVSQGPTRSTIILRSGLQVDLRVVPQKSYGAALYYFTGSKNHNIHVRTLALEKGLKINEYGVFKGNVRLAGSAEIDIFRSLSLPYIEPELREDRGEVEAAQSGRLPQLITLNQIRGDLHAHTTASDGASSLEEMAEAAQDLGYEYLAITDHTKHLAITRGLDPKRLRRQMNQIDKLNSRWKTFRLLKAAEVDILDDGRLDLPDDVLVELDLVLGAIHSNLNMAPAKQTDRILRALDNPYLQILAHPTGRILGERAEASFDLERVMRAALECGCFLEVNAQPKRLDLNDVHCLFAKHIGVKLALSSDAHSIESLKLMRFAVDQGRRGWLEQADVINTLPWSELRKRLRMFTPH